MLSMLGSSSAAAHPRPPFERRSLAWNLTIVPPIQRQQTITGLDIVSRSVTTPRMMASSQTLRSAPRATDLLSL